MRYLGDKCLQQPTAPGGLQLRGTGALTRIPGRRPPVLTGSSPFSLVPAPCAHTHMHRPTHPATQAHALSLSASCSPTGAHPLEAHAPVSLLPLACSASLCFVVPSSRPIRLLHHSGFRSLSLPRPGPFSRTHTHQRAHSFPPILSPFPRPSEARSLHAPHSVHTHTYIFLLPRALTLVHGVTLLFFSFTPQCLLISLLAVTQTHLYIQTHTPPRLCV